MLEVFFLKNIYLNKLNMKTFKILSTIFVVAFLFSGCLYNFIVPEPEIDPGDPNLPEVSFETDILPVFNNNNNCTSCHDTGGQRPDLTTANAYTSLNNTRYLNLTTPEESRIYTKPHPGSNHAEKYSASEAALVLAWITQGAQDN